MQVLAGEAQPECLMLHINLSLCGTRVPQGSATLKVRGKAQRRDIPPQHFTCPGTAYARPIANLQKYLDIPPGGTAVPQLLPLLSVRSQEKQDIAFLKEDPGSSPNPNPASAPFALLLTFHIALVGVLLQQRAVTH